MSTNVEERLSQVRAKQSEAQRRRARAEAQRDEAKRRLSEGMKTLKEEYDCDDLDEAEALMQALREETDTVLADIEKRVEGL